MRFMCAALLSVSVGTTVSRLTRLDLPGTYTAFPADKKYLSPLHGYVWLESGTIQAMYDGATVEYRDREGRIKRKAKSGIDAVEKLVLTLLHDIDGVVRARGSGHAPNEPMMYVDASATGLIMQLIDQHVAVGGAQWREEPPEGVEWQRVPLHPKAPPTAKKKFQCAGKTYTQARDCFLGSLEAFFKKLFNGKPATVVEQQRKIAQGFAYAIDHLLTKGGAVYPLHTVHGIILAYLWDKVENSAGLSPYIREAAGTDAMRAFESKKKRPPSELYEEYKTIVSSDGTWKALKAGDTGNDQYEALVFGVNYSILPEVMPYITVRIPQYGDEFSDCGETALRDILNALLFDPARQAFDPSILEDAFGADTAAVGIVIDFYRNHAQTMSQMLEVSTYNKWAALIADVGNNAPVGENLSEDLKKSVAFGKGVCELVGGADSVLRLLNRLFGVTSYDDFADKIQKALTPRGITFSLEQALSSNGLRTGTIGLTIEKEHEYRNELRWTLQEGHFKVEQTEKWVGEQYTVEGDVLNVLSRLDHGDLDVELKQRVFDLLGLAYRDSIISRGAKAFAAAVQDDKGDIVELLIRADVEFNKEVELQGGEKSTVGVLALIAAASLGREDIVELLINRGLDLNEEAKNRVGIKLPVGADAIAIAAGNGRKDIIQLLIGQGLDFNKEMIFPGGARLAVGTFVLDAAATADQWDIVDQLMGAGVDGAQVLKDAVRENEWDLVDKLIDAGVGMTGKDGTLALASAGSAQQWDIVELLLDRGVPVDSVVGDQLYDDALDAGQDELAERIAAALRKSRGAEIEEVPRAARLRELEQ